MSWAEISPRRYRVLKALFAGLLAKGAHHKYLKRVPTGKVSKTGKPLYRYFYKVAGGTAHVAHEPDLIKVGAAFKLKDEGRLGHVHVVASDGDKVTLKHDETGRIVTMSAAELKARLHREHARAIVDARNRGVTARVVELAAAEKHGSPKQKAAAKRRAAAAGVPGATIDAISGGGGGGRKRPPAKAIVVPEPVAPEPAPEPTPEPETVTPPPVEMVAFKVSENRPPNFLGLRPEAFHYRSVQSGRFTNHVPDVEADEFLLDSGFWDTLAPGFQRDFFMSQVVRKSSYDKMGTRAAEIWGGMVPRLVSWWTNLTDEERERFWKGYVDDSQQAVVGRVDDPRHENADLSIPAGMEKLAAKSTDGKAWDFHVYQKKAINFAADHAKRALWGMEMGLGKTLSALGLFHHLKARGEVRQMFVTAPLSAHGSWIDHFNDFSDVKTVVLTGANKKKRDEAYAKFRAGEIDVLVVSPDTIAVSETSALVKERGKTSVEKTVAKLEAAPVGTEIRIGSGMGDKSTYTRRDGWWFLNGSRNGVSSADIVDQLVAREAHWESIGAKNDRAKSTLVRDEPETAAERREWNSLSKQDITWIAPDGDYSQLAAIMGEKGGQCLRIADEVHKFKNPESARSKGFWDVMSSPEGRLVGMTGTPKPNGAADFYHIVNGISPGAFGGGGLREFAQRYCYTDDRGEITAIRPEKLRALYEDSANVMFARTTADPDSKIHMPPRRDFAPRIPEDATQERVHERLIHWAKEWQRKRQFEREARRAEDRGDVYAAERFYQQAYAIGAAIAEAAGDDNSDPLDRAAATSFPKDPKAALIRWAQLAIHPGLLDDRLYDSLPTYESPKLAAVADATTEHLSQNPDKGAVVFCEYNGGLRAMKRALISRGMAEDKIGVYNGATSANNRRKLQNDLNEGKIKVLLGNTGALETGANLQKRANFVAHLNTPWAPDRLAQSTARVDRQGQTNPVTVFRPIGSHIEELIEGTVSRKLLEASQLTGRTMTSDSAIAGSIRKYGKFKLDKHGIAAALGLAPDFFADEDVTPERPEEIAARLNEADEATGRVDLHRWLDRQPPVQSFESGHVAKAQLSDEKVAELLCGLAPVGGLYPVDVEPARRSRLIHALGAHLRRREMPVPAWLARELGDAAQSSLAAALRGDA